MAKLNVTVPAVDVEVNGVKYRKVERDAQVGDIIRYVDDEASYVTTGAFYEVTRIDEFGDPQIVDNDGDEHDLCGEEFDVYAKVTEPTAEYREVKRWAEPGERIRIVRKASGEDRYKNGAEFVVDSVDGDGDVRVTVGAESYVCVVLSEYVVLEPATSAESAPKRLTVGDYARVIADSRESHDYGIGSFVKIVRDDEDRQPYRAEKADGTEGNFLAEKDVEPATEAEFLAQKRLKVGEFAKVIGKTWTTTCGYVSVGDVVKITKDDDSRRPFKADTVGGMRAGWFTESELVRATHEEVAEAKRKLTIEVSSTVRLTIKDGASPKHGWGEVRNGAIGKVTSISGDSARVDFPAQSHWHALLTELTLVSDGEKTQSQPEPARLKVGEYARTLIVKAGMPKGSIVKITRDDEDSNPFRSVLLDGSAYHYYTQEELERVDAETAKWATIGREVNEFKDGDVVQFTESTGATDYPSGSIAVIRNVSGTSFDFGDSVYFPYGGDTSWVRLITPIEQRFDRTELEATKAAA